MNFFKNFFYAGIKDKIPYYTKRKIFFINFFSFIGAITAFLGVIAYSYYQNFHVALMRLISCILSLFNIFYIRKTKKITLASYVVLGIMFVVLLHLFITGGIQRTGIYWFFTFPVLAFFLEGKKKGWIWIISLLSSVTLIKALQSLKIIKKASYNNTEYLELLVAFIIVSLMVSFFEIVRVKYEKQLKSKTDSLAKANIKLEKALKTKTDFFSIASHDIRSPLAGIISLTEYLLEEQLNDSHKDEIDIIKRTASAQLKYVNNILELLTAEKGIIKLDLSETNVDDLIKNSINMFKFLMENKNIELQTKLNYKLSANLDQNKIIQVVNNLLSNAIKFTHPGGLIKIESFLNQNNEIEVHFKDNGIGIPEDQTKILFESFKKVHEIGTKGEKGTGLGLAISKKFIDLHDGDLKVNSELEKGSDFYFTIPIN